MSEVKRYWEGDVDVVLAADYDALLAVLRQCVEAMEAYMELPNAYGSKLMGRALSSARPYIERKEEEYPE